LKNSIELPAVHPDSEKNAEIGRSSGSPGFLSLPVVKDSGWDSEIHSMGLQLRVQLRNFTGFPF
jgi:hypothetical protein